MDLWITFRRSSFARTKNRAVLPYMNTPLIILPLQYRKLWVPLMEGSAGITDDLNVSTVCWLSEIKEKGPPFQGAHNIDLHDFL
jgi:hypothetical protein